MSANRPYSHHPAPWRLRRTGAVVALFIGPSSLIVTSVAQWTLQPSGVNPTAADVASQFPTAWLVLGMLSVFGPLVWLAGIPAVIGLAPVKGATLTTIGGLLTGLGLAAGIGHLALYFGFYGAMAAGGLHSSDVHRLDAASSADPMGNVLLFVFLIAFALGPILLTIGLRVAHVVAVWVPIAAIVTAAASFLGGPVAGVVQLVTLALVWTPIIVRLLRGSASAVPTGTAGRTTLLEQRQAPTRP